MTKKFTKFPPRPVDNSHLIKARVKHEWSEYQKDIFREISKGTGNFLVIARAGSSKTSVLIEGSRYVPKKQSILFVAFNKAIAEELRSRLNEFVNTSTLHSLGFKAIKLRFGNVELDDHKCWNIVKEFFDNEKENYDLIDNICKAITFCKSNLVDTPSGIEEIVFYYDLDLCEIEMKDFIKYVSSGLRKCKEQTNIIDFNDMIWLPFVYRLNPGKFSVVFIDEAQDMSKAMIELALSAVKPDGRVIAVLDDFQAIYSFMGADSKVLNNLRIRLKPKEFPLPICYRCPKLIVEEAKKFVPDILPYEKSPDGTITNILIDDLMKLAKPGSYVLGRFNAPLIKQCLKFLKNGISANMLGRDIGNNLSFLLKKSKKKKTTDFLKWLDNWQKDEKERLLSKYPKASTENITDKVECLENLCEGTVIVEEVKKNIENLFKDGDEKKIVTLSSIHRIKGRQSNDVFVLADTLRNHTQEELNLHYVSITRSQTNLYMVYNKILPEDLENLNKIIVDKYT